MRHSAGLVGSLRPTTWHHPAHAPADPEAIALTPSRTPPRGPARTPARPSPRKPAPSRGREQPRPGLDAVRENPTWVLLPLRAFLAFTFLYAGLSKIGDRSF